MEDQILELLLEMKKDMSNIKQELSSINSKIDKLEYKMNDGFETLEMLSENNSTEINRLNVKVSKLEKRVYEINKIN